MRNEPDCLERMPNGLGLGLPKVKDCGAVCEAVRLWTWSCLWDSGSSPSLPPSLPLHKHVECRQTIDASEFLPLTSGVGNLSRLRRIRLASVPLPLLLLHQTES